MVGAPLDRRRARHLVWAALVVAPLALALRASGQEMPAGRSDPLASPPGDTPLPSKLASPRSATDSVKRRDPLGAFPDEWNKPLGAHGPVPAGGMSPSSPYESPPPIGLTGKEIVVAIRIEGIDDPKQRQKVQRFISTRVNRRYDPQSVNEDVRRLWKSKLYHVDVSTERAGPNGLIVVFRIHETPTIKYIKFVGNHIAKRHLLKQCGLKVGESRDRNIIEDGKNKLLEYYQEKGFNRATVTIARGLDLKDEGVVFVINEGQRQKVWSVQFEGNTVAPDGRLKSIVKSKPPLLYLFKGEVERDRIEGDVVRLMEYYHGLGFFRVRIGREMQFDEKQKWMTLRFIIDEGPRYKVRQVTFVGPKVFPKQELNDMLLVKQGDYFDKSKVDKDVDSMKDKYGALGYVFALIEPNSRFHEEPGELDLVYQIEEGRPCIVSRVDVKISGDNPHTRRNTILNRVSLHPGDLLNTVELRNSERRLKGAALFKAQAPDEPKITFRPPEGDASELAERPGGVGGFRGQSPDAPAPTRMPAAPPQHLRRPAVTQDPVSAPTRAPPRAPTKRRSRGYLGIRAPTREAP